MCCNKEASKILGTKGERNHWDDLIGAWTNSFPSRRKWGKVIERSGSLRTAENSDGWRLRHKGQRHLGEEKKLKQSHGVENARIALIL